MTWPGSPQLHRALADQGCFGYWVKSENNPGVTSVLENLCLKGPWEGLETEPFSTLLAGNSSIFKETFQTSFVGELTNSLLAALRRSDRPAFHPVPPAALVPPVPGDTQCFVTLFFGFLLSAAPFIYLCASVKSPACPPGQQDPEEWREPLANQS